MNVSSAVGAGLASEVDSFPDRAQAPAAHRDVHEKQGGQRVLIAMNDAGGGHRRLSEALAHGLVELSSGDTEVRIVDLFALDRRSLPYRMARLYGPLIRQLPSLYGLLYHATNGRRRVRRLVLSSQERLLPPVRALLRELRPNVVATTHPLVNALVLDALEREGLDVPVLAQVSELVSVHASWVEPRIDAYSVATEEARLAVLAHGARAARVRVLGLPTAPHFRPTPDADIEARRRLDLREGPFTLLAVGGGEGAGSLEMAVQALLESGLEMQLIVVCGRNQALQRRLRELPAPFPTRVLGYVDNMAELMAASDAVLTKGGPQSIAEAFVIGRPVLVTRALPGQEEGNETFVQSHGAGFHVPTPERVVAAVARLVLDEDARAAAAAAAARLGRPDAAREAARWVLGLARQRSRGAI